MQDTESATLDLLDAADVAAELFELKIKYDRLKDSHRKLLSVNQNLEDKLLQNINRYETEKFSLVHTISSVNLQLEELQRINQRLLAENERFKLDISVAIQLLHCRPSSFSSCKLENLPAEFQTKAKFHMQQELPRYNNRPEKKGKVIRVPISAFPSTTVIYSVPSGDDDEGDNDTISSADTTVSALTMAKVLEERQRELDCQTPNGNSSMETGQFSIGGRLHPSRSLPFLGDGMQYVDHGTQTYPNFIGEREKTRNTCIYCQGNQSEHSKSAHGVNHCLPPPVEPKVFVYTESETTPLTPRNSGNKTRGGVANRRKGSKINTSSSGSMETEI